MTKEEFIARFGNRYSRCDEAGVHPAHPWETPLEGETSEMWWCSGETLAGWERDLRNPVRPDSKESLGRFLSRGEQQPGIPKEEAEKTLRQDFGVSRYPDEHGWETDKTAKAAAAATENRKLPVKWADRAMFAAEPIEPADGPKVYLLWMTPDPLGAIAAACKMYKGEVVRDLSTVTDDERLEYLAQVQKTKLKAPFEFVKFHFLIEGVTRAFTHQMVRQRTAVYAQESLRFAVLGDEDRRIPVGLPPSLSGTDDWADVGFYGQRIEREPSPAERMRQKWEDALSVVDEAYGELIEMGMPAEDARGLLPHNTLTRLHYSTDLRALLDHAGNRLCTQAQFEWRLVFARLIEAIRSKSAGPLVKATDMGPGQCNGQDTIYMADKLADLFKPVCYQTGKCEFKANFDRDCSIRSRVDAFETAGIPSEGWHSDGWVNSATREPLDGIKPGEWLLDPGAARRQ